MPVTIEKYGLVWTVILHRPEVRNAVDNPTADALHDAFRVFDEDDEARVAVFWGAGGAFCAGWDLGAAAAAGAEKALSGLDFPEGGGFAPRGPMGPTRLALDKPVIAAIEGPAVAGGLEMALWCDLRIMAEGAYVGVYCRRWGVPLIDGGTVRLPRIVGQGRALDMILTGRKVEAEEAYRWGLADRLVPVGKARETAEALAAEIARFPQGCMRADRRSAFAQWGKEEREALEAEWANSARFVAAEGLAGATRFKGGLGRGGDFSRI